MSTELWLTAAKMALWIVFLLQVTPIMVWVERRGSALIQDRLGPNRVGPLGLFQALADAAKFIFKEDIVRPRPIADVPAGAAAGLVPSLTTFLVIPFGPDIEVGGETVKLMVVDADTGILLFLALASLGVYSLVMAGYASNNKYSLLGSIRATSQMISYELALGLAAITVLLPVESLAPRRGGALPAGHLARLPAPLEHLPAGDRLPGLHGGVVRRDQPAAVRPARGRVRARRRLPHRVQLDEVRPLLHGRVHVDGDPLGARRDALPRAAGTCPASVHLRPLGNALLGFGILAAKIGAILLFFVWVRWTFPRFRFDQLLRLGWKVLCPWRCSTSSWSPP